MKDSFTADKPFSAGVWFKTSGEDGTFSNMEPFDFIDTTLLPVGRGGKDFQFHSRCQFMKPLERIIAIAEWELTREPEEWHFFTATM